MVYVDDDSKQRDNSNNNKNDARPDPLSFGGLLDNPMAWYIKNIYVHDQM